MIRIVALVEEDQLLFATHRHTNTSNPAGRCDTRVYLRPLPLVLAAVLAGTAISVYVAPPSVGPLLWRAGKYDLLINIVLYIPVGVVLSRYGVVKCGLAGVALSILVETTQLFLPDRFTAASDVIANTTGTVIGCLAMRISGARGRQLLNSVALTRGLGVVFLLIGVGFGWWVSWPRLPADFRNWDPACRLSVGDEVSGDRFWDGEIFDIMILPDYLDAEAVRRASAGPGPDRPYLRALRSRAVFKRAFSGDFRSAQGMSLLDSLELDPFYRALTEAGQLSILVWFRTDDESQGGPARIVSYSTSIWKQNFALGQEGRNIVFRVLTPTTAPGGFTPQLETRGVLAAGHDAVLAATYDGRTSSVYLDGRLISRLNLKARGRSSPFLADIGLPASAICVGTLMGLGMIGLARGGGRYRWLTGGLAGLVGTMLFILVGGVDALPEFTPWAILFGLAGGVVAGLSTAVHSSARGT
ncbi:MAG: VanZ family protein [Candidatus Latescibacterota bacterium]|nr:MAG: VanZ family protein [Candidatus Latescibacterota bacterium]